MNSEEFELLVNVVESLENEGMKNTSLKGAIVKIVKQFDHRLNDNQRKRVVFELSYFEKTRLEKNFEVLESEKL